MHWKCFTVNVLCSLDEWCVVCISKMSVFQEMNETQPSNASGKLALFKNVISVGVPRVQNLWPLSCKSSTKAIKKHIKSSSGRRYSKIHDIQKRERERGIGEEKQKTSRPERNPRDFKLKQEQQRFRNMSVLVGRKLRCVLKLKCIGEDAAWGQTHQLMKLETFFKFQVAQPITENIARI